jgi:DNA-directed RNA polymerase subunit H (RpoH/RPB5)
MAYFYRSYESLKDEIKHLIFIYSIATIQIKKLKTYKDVLKVEFFNLFELNRLLTGNRFIPKHRQVCASEREEIVQKFGKNNLPLISITDPIVKLYDFDLDSIVEIERENTIYYRLVVQDD